MHKHTQSRSTIAEEEQGEQEEEEMKRSGKRVERKNVNSSSERTNERMALPIKINIQTADSSQSVVQARVLKLRSQ